LPSDTGTKVSDTVNVVCGHCGKAVDTSPDVGQGLLCPRCGSKVTVPDLASQAAQPPDPDETHVFEAVDVSFADQAREAMKKTSKIHLTCGSCGRHLTIGARLAGKRAKCPSCRSHIRVPYPDDADDFEIEALAMAAEEPAEELDLSYGDAPGAAAHALHQAESRTVGPGGVGTETRRQAVKRRHAARVREIKRSRRKLVAYLFLTAVAMWAFVWFLAWPLLYGEDDAPTRNRDNGSHVATSGNGDGRLGPNGDGSTNGNGNHADNGNGNGGAAATKPAPKRRPRFRVVQTRVGPFAHDGYFPAPVGKAYWHVTIDIQAGSQPFVMKTAGMQAVVTSMDQEFASLGTPGGGGVLPRRLSTPTLTIAPRKVQRLELLFELPQEYRRGTVVLADVGSRKISGGDTFAPVDPTGLVGRFEEVLPRNLKPLLDQPVMAALQSAGPGEMIAAAAEGGFSLRFPQAGVRGLAAHEQGGRYAVTLRHDGDRLEATLRLIDGGKRAILHLAEGPWRAMTFVRKGTTIDRDAGVTRGSGSATKPTGPVKRDPPDESGDEDDGNDATTRPRRSNGAVNEPRFFDD
jgi:DNA-directed RNA polymerase subunit RPC12/RpoP